MNDAKTVLPRAWLAVQVAPSIQTRIKQIKKGPVDILIGCVDTRKARRAINRWTLRSRVLYWLDLGNNAASGQFVLGQPNNSVNRKKKQRLRTVAELYPEIVSTEGKEDDQPSCSAAETFLFPDCRRIPG